jgi:hypothetical protein
VTLPIELVQACARVVARAGGDAHDFDELIAVHERAARRGGERCDVIRREAREGAARLAELEGQTR